MGISSDYEDLFSTLNKYKVKYLAPVRVDIIMGLSGLDFNSAWRGRTRSKYGAIAINILGLKELIKSKKILSRKQDILDVEKLTVLKTEKRKQLRKRRYKRRDK